MPKLPLPDPLDMVSNILDYWRRAPHLRDAGAGWYPVALEIAEEIGALARTTTPIATGAALLAVLSPRSQWTRNIANARAVAVLPDRRPSGLFDANYQKARRLALGAQPREVLGGRKVISFYRNILGDDTCVTVDGWAWKVACGDLPVKYLERKGAYDSVEAAYIFAANHVKVDPATIQATTWLLAQAEGRRETALARAATRRENR